MNDCNIYESLFPSHEFSYEWQNRERPEPAISVLGRSLTLNREVFNVLKVNYSRFELFWKTTRKRGFYARFMLTPEFR